MAAIPLSPTDLFSRVLENLNTAVLLYSEDLELQYINPAGEMLFGASMRQLRGLTLAEMIQPREPLMPQIEEALETVHPFSKHEQAMELLHGKEVTADLTVTILKETAARAEILVELTPVDRMLRISREEHRVAQQNATRELLRGLAHEIKNPLGGLRGAAQLLEKQLENEELREYTHVIIDEADRLQKLVNRILGPSGASRRKPVNVHELLEYVFNLVSKDVRHGIAFHRDYDPSIPDITGDSDQLIQAILNIVSNAIEALGGDGNITFRTRVLRKFTIGQQQHRLVVRIDIIDDGPGVPEQVKEQIFFPMITTRADGSGLGLSIAQSLIHQHGGLIECESHPGRTVFSILLPMNNKGE
jgi:two-component system nitrogen regulation sensor histidine kinase GlnL